MDVVILAVFQTNGTSNGLIPMLRVYNNTARYVDQGGNKVTDCCIVTRPRNITSHRFSKIC